MSDGVTLTITTCKRLSLFKRTIGSLIEKCKDLDLITHVLCVDDNSSPDDRDAMLEVLNISFPNRDVRLYCKSPQQRGLAYSMNIILENVTTKYIFHIEDDWEFIKEDNFITKALAIIKETDNVKSVLVRNYDFLAKSVTPSGNEYRVLEVGQIVTQSGVDSTWKHGYSLNPSVQDIEAIKSKHLLFPNFQVEYIFGVKFYEAGFRAATLTEEYVAHIGENYSSFDLNGTPR